MFGWVFNIGRVIVWGIRPVKTPQAEFTTTGLMLPTASIMNFSSAVASNISLYSVLYIYVSVNSCVGVMCGIFTGTVVVDLISTIIVLHVFSMSSYLSLASGGLLVVYTPVVMGN